MEVVLSILLSLFITAGGLFVLSYADYLAAQNQRAISRLSNRAHHPLTLEQTFRLPWLWPQWILTGVVSFLISVLIGLISIWLLVVIAFMGFIAFGVFLWQDIRQISRANLSIPDRGPVAPPLRPHREKAQLYGLHGEYKGQTLDCTHDTLIGRSNQCHIRLKKSDVSSRHARIVYAQGTWFIQDMSRWGTLVDGISIKAQALGHGSKIRISNTEFEFRIE